MSRICILGGGFGGLYTALSLVRLPWAETPEIILIDKSDRFLFTPLLYELVTGELQAWEISPTFADLLADTGIHFVQGHVNDINVEDREVSIAIASEVATMNYDRLLIAIGGETPIDLVPGASEYAIPFRTLADVERLEQRLSLLEKSGREKIRVCIAGAGASGIELACKIADRLKDRGRVRIVDRNATILPNSTAASRAIAERALLGRGVWLDLSTSVSEVAEQEVTLDHSSGSDTLPVDIVMWTVGNSFSRLIQKLPLPHTQRGQILTGSTLQVQDRPDIFAIGDLASCSNENTDPLPATAQVAFQQAQYCAFNIWASLHDRDLQPFRYLALGEFICLGTDNAAMSAFGRFSVDGIPAYALRRFAYLLRMPTLQHQLKVGFNWISKPILEAISSRMPPAANQRR
jgi:demethylphylloquinone reductase